MVGFSPVSSLFLVSSEQLLLLSGFGIVLTILFD